MTDDEILLDVEERMEKAIGVLKGSLAGIRTPCGPLRGDGDR